MDKKEQDILKMIKEQTEETKVPESLEPETVRKKLEERDGKERKRKRNRRKIWQISGLAAACVALAAGIFVYQNVRDDSRNYLGKDGKEDVKISSERTIASAESYGEIYKYIEENHKPEDDVVYEAMPLDGSKTDEVRKESATDSAAGSSIAKTGSRTAEQSAGSGSYSTTNIRQEGVDEGDVAKTDGTYLYVLKDDGLSVSVIDTREQMKEVSVIEAGKDAYIEEFYMLPQEKKVILICSVTPSYTKLYPGGNVWDTSKVTAVTYDVSDAGNPKQAGEITQSGGYHSSRFTDGYLYLFSQYYPGTQIRKSKPDTFIPLVNGKVMEEQDIYMPMTEHAGTFTVVTAVKLEKPGEIADSKAIFTKGGQIYVSNENIYYYEEEWDAYGTNGTTTLRKISYNKGQLKAVAQGSIPGYINDSFSIDEYKENLRVVTTVGDTNSVYVLNRKLKTIGKIENLAKDERIYSARFMGETGYFVTFRETDPLFSVDLSNPEKPKIIGALKIPGFSDYLHFYGEGKLLGIGMDVDERTGTTDGVKLTLFDISDKTDVKEIDTYVLENVYSTDISYDYKAAMIDVDRNMIGFCGYTDGAAKYYLFSYEEGEGFCCNLEETINGNSSRAARGLYIDKTLYVVQGNVIEAYSLEDYEKVDDLIL